MNEQECLAKMIAPGTRRPGKWRGGIIQVHITRACDKSCYGCTQGSNLGGKPVLMTPEQFETALSSLRGYWGVVGIFGGNPCLHPEFEELCRILTNHFPFEQRGLWSNNLMGRGAVVLKTFNPAVSNLNVHLDRDAFDEMWRDWPEARRMIKGLEQDSRHSPPFVGMSDLLPDEGKRWDLIANCDINQHWSALVGVVPGRGVRAYFCELAYAQAALHADDPLWTDTGIQIGEDGFPPLIYPLDGSHRGKRWWELPMTAFAEQVRNHCHNCGVPLRRLGQLAVGGTREEVSLVHLDVYRPKVKGREVVVIRQDGPHEPRTPKVTKYLETER